jgi:hypothetical protein
LDGPLLPWILALVAIAAAGLLAALWMARPKPPASRPLPTEWAITARPVFSTDERRVYRQLREALPHHVVLSKLPLVRFCQPNDPDEVRYWYDLLGQIHVTFAICSANGRVLAAIDLDTDRGSSRRTMQIKQAVLNACRVRYLRCPADHLPSIPELQLLVPQSSAATRGPQPAPARVASPSPALHPPAPLAPARRRERVTLWQDSGFFQDSFFAPDNRQDSPGTSDFQGLSTTPADDRTSSRSTESTSADDIGGVVVDSPRTSAPSRR